ncbi:hypothetical protein M3J09_013084 [Ascochyta lentis]
MWFYETSFAFVSSICASFLNEIVHSVVGRFDVVGVEGCVLLVVEVVDCVFYWRVIWVI